MQSNPPDDARREPGGSTTSRRAFLFQATGATLATTAVAGCLDAVEDRSATASSTLVLGEDVDVLARSGFEAFVAEMGDRYRDSGVWGGTDPGTHDDLEYVEAWSHSAGPDDGRPVETDHVVARYRVTGKTDDRGREYFRFWQWSGARTPAVDDAGTPAIRRLGNSLDFTRSEVDVLSYAPDADRSGDRVVRVGMETPLASGPAGAVPLHGGTQGPGESRVGSAGRFEVRWSGRSSPTQSVAGLCAVRHPPGVDPRPTWTLSVRA